MEVHSIEKSYLPNKFPEIWKKMQEMFNTEIKSIKDINLTKTKRKI